VADGRRSKTACCAATAADTGSVRSCARDERSLESLHEWRKRVKDVWYHLRLLQPVCGRTVRGQAKEASRLADVLGEDHDLGVLNMTLDQIERDLATVRREAEAIRAAHAPLLEGRSGAR
jgi:CHAD domain-containing protein